MAKKLLTAAQEAERARKALSAKLDSHEFWYKITKGEPGFTTAFNRALRNELEIKGIDNWKIVDETLKKPWIKEYDKINGVTRYVVVPHQ